jgi:hypothetical protein
MKQHKIAGPTEHQYNYLSFTIFLSFVSQLNFKSPLKVNSLNRWPQLQFQKCLTARHYTKIMSDCFHLY